MRNTVFFRNNNTVTLLMVVLLMTAGFAFRALFLTADPPKDITISGGIIGDPGQYQYGARNQVLFGQAALDNFTPHLLSPLIHPLNTLIYKWFGITLTTHRMVPLLFSVLILILFWVMMKRLLDPVSALLGTFFLAFSYPVIMYSHVAYREYPMTFFCMLSFWAFSKGADSPKIKPFFFSALFFFLSYLSKGSGIYLLAVFLGVGFVWLLEKRVNWRQVAVFSSTLFSCATLWWFTIYRANPLLMGIFMADNRNVRRVESLSAMLSNLWHSPMMLILRNDPVLFLLAGFTLLWLIRDRFSRPRELPPLIDIAVAWLTVGAFFHGIVNYRPTRFYLILVVPMSMIAGYGLCKLLPGPWQPSRRKTLASLLSLPALALLLTALGFPAFLSRFMRGPLAQILLMITVLFSLIFLFGLKISPRLRRILLAFVMAASIAGNAQAYLRWAKHRSYEMPAIIEILSKAIPPSRIAGNWASHLSIGTPHRTYYAWKGFFNWQTDFLSRNQIEYLLLAKSPTFNEIADYQNFFSAEWSRSQLMAEFELNNASVHLIRIKPPENSSRKTETEPMHIAFEIEALKRSVGSVRYHSQASQQMAVLVPPVGEVNFTLREPVSMVVGGLSIRASGRFSLQIRGNQKAMTRILVNTSSTQIQEITRQFDPPLHLSEQELSLSIEALDKNQPLILDRIVLTRAP